jgi:hypothetical protein
MADNVSITAGSGTAVATDDAGGVHYQQIKLVDGTADSTAVIPGSASRGLYVDPHGTTTRIQVTPTISAASIYAAKDAIGGIMTFAGATRTSTGGGILESVTIVDKDQELSPMDLVLFSATIAGTVTDNAAFDPTDADLLNCVGWIPILAGDYADFNDNAVAVRAGLGIAYTCAATSLFGALVARATPTYTNTSDIVVTLGVIPD